MWAIPSNWATLVPFKTPTMTARITISAADWIANDTFDSRFRSRESRVMCSSKLYDGKMLSLMTAGKHEQKAHVFSPAATAIADSRTSGKLRTRPWTGLYENYTSEIRENCSYRGKRQSRRLREKVSTNVPIKLYIRFSLKAPWYAINPTMYNPRDQSELNITCYFRKAIHSPAPICHFDTCSTPSQAKLSATATSVKTIKILGRQLP